jgi:Glycosyl transferases group 1
VAERVKVALIDEALTFMSVYGAPADIRDLCAMSHCITASGKDVFSTIEAPLRKAWRARVHTPPRELSGLGRLRHIVQVGGSYPRVVLDGSEREALLAATFLARRRRPPAVVMADATWRSANNPLDYLASHLGLFPLDGSHVRYCVHSALERDRFSTTWRVDPTRVIFTPYCHTLSDEELATPTSDEGGVFAGGDSLRDYPTLIEAARIVPFPVRIATRRTNEGWARDLPANVIASALSHREFNERIASTSVVVVPLKSRDDRGSGQTTYLNAMALGKAVIVTDVAGARDYIRDGQTGLIVPPEDPDALSQALRRLLEDGDYRRRVGSAARRDALDRFGPDRYVEQLLAVVDAASAVDGADK